MKIDARRFAAILRDPGSTRAVLLYGDDLGLIRERADALTRAVAGSLDDPFRVARLERERHGLLAEEATAQSLIGGRRAVRVDEAGDAIVPRLQEILAGPGDAVLILEAPGLASRSKLRTLAEKHDSIAALGSYPEEGRALEASIRARLNEVDIVIEPDALSWVASQLGSDQAMMRQEIDKLSLYAAETGRIDLADAQACVGDAASASLDGALHAATRGDPAATDRLVGLALADGAAPVGLLRAAAGHLQRLHRARLGMAGGQSGSDAMRAMRPPVFFRYQADMVRALTGWSAEALAEAMAGIFAAEQACKRTGAPAEAIAARALLTIALRARQQAR
jgi:DNA polymerase-3 subunit delta